MLPIQTIANDIKQFKKDLKQKLENVELSETKSKQVREWRQLLGEMYHQLQEQIDLIPEFTVDATLDNDAGLEERENVIDDKTSKAFAEREKSLAALRDVMADIDQKIEEQKDSNLLNEVKSVSKLAEIRVEQQIEEETNCCTRIFCCFFPQSRQKLEELSADKIIKQKESVAAIERLRNEKGKLKEEAEKHAEVDHKKIDAAIDARIILKKEEAKAKVRAERGYDAYKYTVNEDIMLLLLRINSCVRRIEMIFVNAAKPKKNTSESTPLMDQSSIKEVKIFLEEYDKKLEGLCKSLYCVNPDDEGHKIYFKDYYRRYHHEKNENEKTNFLKGNISDRLREHIFSWEIPLQARPALLSASSRRNSIRH